MKSVEYRLPWPPSLNRAYRAVSGRVLLSELGRGYVKKVINALPKGVVKPFDGRLDVTYLLSPPEALTGLWDIANREKVLSDALTKARVWHDDSQIDRLLVVRDKVDSRAGCVYVIIQEIKREN